MTGTDDGQTEQRCDHVILVGQCFEPGDLEDMFSPLLVPLLSQSDDQGAMAKDEQLASGGQAKVDSIQPVILWKEGEIWVLLGVGLGGFLRRLWVDN